MKRIEDEVKEMILKNHKSMRAFANEIGVAHTTLDSVFRRGFMNSGLSTVFNICQALNIDADELAKDRVVFNANSDDSSLPDNIFPIETQKIPLLGEIAAGVPIFADEQFDSYVEVGANIKADFCFRVKGDSMINARINDGDIVFVRKQSMVEDGQIAVVLVGDEATLKRIFISEDEVMLVAENHTYKPVIYRDNELDSVRILGRAVSFQSDIK